MPKSDIKVIESRGAVQANGSVEAFGNEILFAGRLRPSPEAFKALEVYQGQSGELSGLKDLDYQCGFKFVNGEVEVNKEKDKGKVFVNLGTKLNIIDSDNKLFAATEGERLITTELTDDFERIFSPRWNVRFEATNPTSSVAGWEFKTGKALTQFTLSEDQKTLSVTIADPRKNFLCSFIFEDTEKTPDKAEEKIFKMLLKEGERGVILKVNPETESCKLLGSFGINDVLEHRPGVEMSEDQIKGIMGISYSNNKIGTVDFNVYYDGENFGCTFNADIGGIIKVK